MERKKKAKKRDSELLNYKERQNVYVDILSDSREMENVRLERIVSADFEIRMAKAAKQKDGKEGFLGLQRELTVDLRELQRRYPQGYAAHAKELDFLQARILVFMAATVNPVPQLAPAEGTTLFRQRLSASGGCRGNQRR